MNAANVARQLKLLGINVIAVSEPNDLEDGDISITEILHVQVPDEGRALGVVEELPDGHFLFHELTTSVVQIANELKAALAAAALAKSEASPA